MKCQTALLTLLLLVFCGIPVCFARLVVDSKNIVITMKQEAPKSFVSGLMNPYVVTISGDGTVIFDGMDEGKAISRNEPAVKVVRKYKISDRQLKELVDEVEKADFFALDNSYSVRDNGDGTITIIRETGLVTVITSISFNGKTKTIRNLNFAPEKLIELQRKIYLIANLAQFIKMPPYWLSKFPNQMFPRSNEAQMQQPVLNLELRKIPRKSPQNRKDKQIDPARKWGSIKPCVSKKAAIEKFLGKAANKDDTNSLPVYNLRDEYFQILYTNEKTKNAICGSPVPAETVVLFVVTPIKDLKLSELNVDWKQFKINNNSGLGIKSYINLAEGIQIDTEFVEFTDKKQIEMVTQIQISRKVSQK
jgi:hypothetical protein